MGWIDKFLAILPAACLTLAFVHALVWLRRRGNVWHLAFVAAAVSLAALTALEQRLIGTRTTLEYIETSRLLQLPLALLVTSLVSFVRLGLGVGRGWLGSLAVALRFAALLAGFTTGANLYKSEVTAVDLVHAWGTEIPLALGPSNPWAVLGVFANVALIAFCVDAWLATRGRPGVRRRIGSSLVVGTVVAGVPLALFLAALAGMPGWIATPLAFNLAFVPAFLAMSYELSVTVLASEQYESALRTSETRLAETLERAELAVAALGLALFSWDPLRGKLWLSTRARVMFALPAEGEVFLADIFASVHPDDRDGLRESLVDAMAAGGAWDREFRIGTGDSPARWLRAHGSVSSGIDEGLLLHCVATDVTARHADAHELRRLEVEGAQQRDELAHLSRVSILSELSGSLAHELNQPLAAILGNAQAALRYLDRKPLDVEELRAIVTDIVEADRRAGDVIKRLRAMLRKEGANYVELDVNDVVEDALRLMRSDLLNRRVRVRWQPGGGLPHVAGDRVQLQQVLLNLVANASDALAEQAAGMREITISTDRGEIDEFVAVRVSDRGVGVAEGELERMFDPFVTTKPDGIGLGLSVCRSIMGAHHGRIWATRNSDGGTTVQFALPGLASVAEPRARIV